ncbi:MAG: flavin reductase [Alphaproteobacteria bacterium]|nr:flavin reductase [Alphaproteobacteria bacterium]
MPWRLKPPASSPKNDDALPPLSAIRCRAAAARPARRSRQVTIDKRTLRDVLGTFVTGVTVMTTVDESGRAHGCTANSFSSVSLEPPLVLWSQALKARSYAAFSSCRRFVVNILSEDQRGLSQRFASDMADKFEGVACFSGIDGLPVIRGVAAYLECRRTAAYPGGDHSIFIGEVENLQRGVHRPLAFAGGRYMLAFPHEVGSSDASSDDSLTEALRLGNAALADISSRIKASTGLSVWGNHGPTTVRYEHPAGRVWDGLEPGRVLSLAHSATGLVFLAYLPRAATRAMLDEELEAGLASGRAESSTESVERKLAEVRERGLARLFVHRAVQGQDIEIAGFSAPVFDRSGRLVLGLTAIAPASSIKVGWSDPMPSALITEAAELSRRLGYLMPPCG